MCAHITSIDYVHQHVHKYVQEHVKDDVPEYVNVYVHEFAHEDVNDYVQKYLHDYAYEYVHAFVHGKSLGPVHWVPRRNEPGFVQKKVLEQMESFCVGSVLEFCLFILKINR